MSLKRSGNNSLKKAGAEPLKIVDSNSMFTLIDVSKSTEHDAVILKFDAVRYYKYQLIIHGLNEENKFIQKMNEFIDAYIDVDEIEPGKLDFWNDAQQIGIFDFTTYEEVVEPFEIADWISAYESQGIYFQQQNARHTKDEVRWGKFIDNLDVFLKKELRNYEAKSEFLAENQEAKKANIKAIDIAKKIQNLIEDYRIEEQKDKNE